jgi:hypothetical protein
MNMDTRGVSNKVNEAMLITQSRLLVITCISDDMGANVYTAQVYYLGTEETLATCHDIDFVKCVFGTVVDRADNLEIFDKC